MFTLLKVVYKQLNSMYGQMVKRPGSATSSVISTNANVTKLDEILRVQLRNRGNNIHVCTLDRVIQIEVNSENRDPLTGLCLFFRIKMLESTCLDYSMNN